MRGLTIILAEESVDRFRTALSIAAAQAALGGAARIFCEARAVNLLRRDIASADDAAHDVAGLPTLAQMREEALALGVALIACQSGLQLTGTDARALDPRIAFGGIVSVMQALGEDRLLAI